MTWGRLGIQLLYKQEAGGGRDGGVEVCPGKAPYGLFRSVLTLVLASLAPHCYDTSRSFTPVRYSGIGFYSIS